MNHPILAALVFVIGSLVSVSASWSQSANHRMVLPSELTWNDVPALPAGAKIAVIEGPMSEPVVFTVRLKFPPNFRIPPHSHPAVERLTVLSGTVNMGIGDKLDVQKTMPLGPGGMMIIQPKTNHFAWTSEEVIVQLNGTGPSGVTYVKPAGDPRKKK